MVKQTASTIRSPLPGSRSPSPPPAQPSTQSPTRSPPRDTDATWTTETLAARAARKLAAGVIPSGPVIPLPQPGAATAEDRDTSIPERDDDSGAQAMDTETEKTEATLASEPQASASAEKIGTSEVSDMHQPGPQKQQPQPPTAPPTTSGSTPQASVPRATKPAALAAPSKASSASGPQRTRIGVPPLSTQSKGGKPKRRIIVAGDKEMTGKGTTVTGSQRNVPPGFRYRYKLRAATAWAR